VSDRIEISRANFAEFQERMLLIAAHGSEKAVSAAVRSGYEFLRSLPKGSPVDDAHHFDVLTTREERIEHVERFAKRREISLEGLE